MTPQQRTEHSERAGVQYVIRLQPGTTRHGDTPSQAAERRWRVGVGVDDNRDATIVRGTRVHVVEVEPVDLTVDFDRHTSGCRRGKDALGIEPVWLPLQYQPTCRMGEDVYPWAR